MMLTIRPAQAGDVELELRPLPSGLDQVVFVVGFEISPAARRRLGAILAEHTTRARRAVGPFESPYVLHPYWLVTWCGPVVVGSDLHRALERVVPRSQRFALRAFDAKTGRFRLVTADPPVAVVDDVRAA